MCQTAMRRAAMRRAALARTSMCQTAMRRAAMLRAALARTVTRRAACTANLPAVRSPSPTCRRTCKPHVSPASRIAFCFKSADWWIQYNNLQNLLEVIEDLEKLLTLKNVHASVAADDHLARRHRLLNMDLFGPAKNWLSGRGRCLPRVKRPHPGDDRQAKRPT
jgi:hypothetical protein